MEVVALVLLIALIAVSSVLLQRNRRVHESKRRAEHLEQELSQLRPQLERYRPIASVEAEAQRLRQHYEQELASLQQRWNSLEADYGSRRQSIDLELTQARAYADAEIRAATFRINELKTQLVALDEDVSLIEHGFYRPHYDFATSDLYKRELDRIKERQRQLIRDQQAGFGKLELTVDGNAAKGRKLVKDTIKLMLRAFNGESDAAIAKVTYANIKAQEARILRAHEAINKLGAVNHCEISGAYLGLRLDELRITHEHAEKKQAEKEEQRRIKEQMREEQKLQKELDAAQREAEREEKRFADALAKAREEQAKATGARQQQLQAKLAELEEKLAQAHENRTRAVSRAEMTRSGHVYIISNIGSFGEGVYKIGMTRRLDPYDRVRELGDASVPFRFDVHALVYSDDAPALENKLHKRFQHRRLNRMNLRREFFQVSLAEIQSAVEAEHGAVQFTRVAEAQEFRKSVADAAEQGASLEMPVRRAATEVLVGAPMNDGLPVGSAMTPAAVEFTPQYEAG